MISVGKRWRSGLGNHQSHEHECCGRLQTRGKRFQTKTLAAPFSLFASVQNSRAFSDPDVPLDAIQQLRRKLRLVGHTQHGMGLREMGITVAAVSGYVNRFQVASKV